MKTVLIHVFDSNIVRNVLRTGVLKTLVNEKDLKIVLLVQERRIEDYKKEFTYQNVILDTYPRPNATKAELVTWFIARNTITTYNVRQKQEEFLDKKRDRSFRWGKYIIARITFELSKILLFKKIIKSFVRLFVYHHMFDDVMKKYNPDLVFLPTIYTTNDVRLLKYCKKNNIPTVGMIKSWDNLTGKDPVLIPPDTMIVHNNRIKEELFLMHGYPREKVIVTGIPQFDVYADPHFVRPRDEFFKKINLDPQKKLITYTAMGSWIVLHEKEVIQILSDIVKSGKLKYPAQLLVRLHPAYVSEDEELKKIPGITLDRPGGSNFQFNSWRADWEFDIEDTRHLATTLRWSDVVLNSGSTTVIDAACIDTPVINIAFDGYATDEIESRSVHRLLVKEHYKPIVESGGVRMAYNQEELIDILNKYMDNKTLDHEGRQNIVRDQCFVLDGKAGSRIAEHILSRLEIVKK